MEEKTNRPIYLAMDRHIERLKEENLELKLIIDDLSKEKTMFSDKLKTITIYK